MSTLGVDVGGSTTKAVLLDTSGTVVRHVVLPTGDVVTTVLEAVELVGGERRTVGVAVPGIVDRESGRVRGAVNLGLAAGSLDLASELETQLGARCHVENDTNAAAFAASARLGLPDLALLSIGTGLAAGIVLAGRVWHGHRGSAGEVGHLPLGPADAVCTCGGGRCLEATASGGAVQRRWGTTVTAHLQQAPQQATVFIESLVVAVEALLLILDVDVVLAGGAAGPHLHGLVLERLTERSSDSGFRRSLDLAARVHLADTDFPLGAYGAALMAGHD